MIMSGHVFALILSDESRDSCQTFQIVPTFLVLKSLKNNFGAIVDGRLTKVSGPFQRILGFIYNFHSRILLNLPHISTKMQRGQIGILFMNLHQEAM